MKGETVTISTTVASEYLERLLNVLENAGKGSLSPEEGAALLLAQAIKNAEEEHEAWLRDQEWMAGLGDDISF